MANSVLVSSGITERMLTLQLGELEKDHLIKRTVHAEVPARVGYELTEIGKQLIRVWRPGKLGKKSTGR